MSGAASPLVEAYELMRKGALYLIIAWLLVGVGLLFVVFGLLAAGVFGPHRPALGFVGSLVAVIVVLVVGAIIALVGLWGYFIPGTRKLAEARPEFSTSATLIRIGLLYGIIIILVGALLSVVLVGIPLMLVGLILLILGEVGLIILSFKLNDVEKNAMYLAAGILFIIGIFISLAGFVAWILLYVALGESIEKARRAPPAPAPPQPPPPTAVPPPV